MVGVLHLVVTHIHCLCFSTQHSVARVLHVEVTIVFVLCFSMNHSIVGGSLWKLSLLF